MNTNENWNKQLSELIADVYSEYQRELTKFGLASYLTSLRGYDFKSIRDAFFAYQAMPRDFKRHPEPGDILTILEGQCENKAYIAWNYLIACKYECITDDLIAIKALRDIGGYDKLRLTLEHELIFLKKEFIRRYKMHSESALIAKSTNSNMLEYEKTSRLPHINKFINQSKIG